MKHEGKSTADSRGLLTVRDVAIAAFLSLALAVFVIRFTHHSTSANQPHEERARGSGGFTLIELSIVLVIIGLIVGGVLAGQNLIAAAAVRAQISQIEKFNTAANTFFGKYGYLPGDIPAGPAAQFGFAARGQYAGEGDGNGIIEGVKADAPNSNQGFGSDMGETVMFWVDLSAAHLIEGGYTYGSSNSYAYAGCLQPTASYNVPALSAYFPVAKSGNGYVYPFSGGWISGGVNYFGILQISTLCISGPVASAALTVAQAYSIDNKTDDGLPQSGRVQAFYPSYINSNYNWSNGGVMDTGSATTAATSGSAATCYDNGGNAGTQQAYSVEINNGANVTCALSFKMQAGD